MSFFCKEQVRELGYLVIEGKVYDAKSYGLSEHPGTSPHILKMIVFDCWRRWHSTAVAARQRCSECQMLNTYEPPSTNISQTDTFRAFHPDSTYEVLANFYVGDLEQSSLPKVDRTHLISYILIPFSDPFFPAAFTLDVRKLEEDFRTRGFYKSSTLFYTAIQAIALSLLGISVLGLVYLGHTVPGVIASAACLALFFQQAGWLAHDFAHNQVSDSRVISYAGSLVWGPCAQGLSL